MKESVDATVRTTTTHQRYISLGRGTAAECIGRMRRATRGRPETIDWPLDTEDAVSERTHEERRAQGLDVLRTLRGGGDPATAAKALEEGSGAIGSFVVDFALGDVWSRPGLSRRDRSLIVVSMLTALNQERQLAAHARGALNHGLSATEVREILVQLSGYVGFPRALSASAVVEPVLADAAEGPLGPPPPAELKSDTERSRDGAEVLQRLTGGRTQQEPAAALQAIESQLGAVGRYALLFAFGELWSRPQLSRRDRSLVVISALAALARADELRFHFRGALQHGVTKPELQEFLLMVVVYAGFPFAVEAARVAGEVFERSS